jgi:hypothetical protein
MFTLRLDVLDLLNGCAVLSDDALNLLIDDPAMRHAPFVYSDFECGRRVADVLADMLGDDYVVRQTFIGGPVDPMFMFT